MKKKIRSAVYDFSRSGPFYCNPVDLSGDFDIIPTDQYVAAFYDAAGLVMQCVEKAQSRF